MDRRSWLWRRKSSEKSPGETESSGSLSSYSDRFSDDQVYPNQTTPSPEVTSNAAPNEEEILDVKTLRENLSAALLNLSAKEDLVKQHVKVAEEAVSGWEKAETEVLNLKQQLDSSNQKNSVLEDQVSHLDEALKECVRQLQQTREEQEQKIHESDHTTNWKSEKSLLESKIVELEAQLETAKSDAAASIPSDLHQRLEDMEKENLSLKIELQSRVEELEFRIIERDLSAQTAEAASKQHLESIKKLAKVEAECRRSKAIARKALSANDHKSMTASSDTWALVTKVDQIKNENSSGKSSMAPSTEINLMDDFLEMERLAGFSDTESGSKIDQGKIEVEALVQKNAELEKKLEEMVAEKVEVEMALIECKKELGELENWIKEAELKVADLQTQLALSIKSNEEAYEKLEATQDKNEIVESKLRVAQTEVEELFSKICSLEEEIEKERALSAENLAKCEKLEDELLKMNHEAQLLHKEGVNSELKLKQEKELELAASRFAECRKTIESLGQQLKSLAKLEDFLLDQESPVPVEIITCEVMPTPQNGGHQLKLHSSDVSLPKRDSQSSISLNPSINYVKSRNSSGRFYPRSKSVSRTGRH